MLYVREKNPIIYKVRILKGYKVSTDHIFVFGSSMYCVCCVFGAFEGKEEMMMMMIMVVVVLGLVVQKQVE